MRYQPIIGTLGYCISQDRKRVLLIHRNKDREDDHIGKYNGLGGKMESDEDVYTSMKREIFEESGLVAKKMLLRGTINWTGFGKNQENWLGFIFRIDAFEGESLSTCQEGDLKWVEIKKIMKLPLWEGDKQFLPMVFDDNLAPFHGSMSYKGEKMLKSSFVRY